LRSLSEQQHADLRGLWRQEEHAAERIRKFPPQQRDNARLVQSLKDELKEAEHECFELHRLNKELRNGLRQCDGDRVRLEAQNKVLSDRSMKQSEDVLNLRMDLNRREMEFRRAAEVSAPVFRPAQRERERSELPRFNNGDQSPHRSDCHFPPSQRA
jgi:chromosome segregation ATPase